MNSRPAGRRGRNQNRVAHIEAEWGRSIEGVLWELYHFRGMTQQQIADLLVLDRTYVWTLMKRYKIPRRRAVWSLPPSGALSHEATEVSPSVLTAPKEGS
jgi:hypothetical protein